MRPGKPGFRIKSIWAFIATNPEDDSEGIPAALMSGTWMPLMAADEDRVASLRPIARDLVSRGAKIRLVRFDTMVELDEVKP